MIEKNGKPRADEAAAAASSSRSLEATSRRAPQSATM